MPRRLFRPRIWKFAVLLGITAVVAVWWLNRPLASLTLPDGTKIFLRRVSYGTEHQIDEPLDSGATTWERVRHVLFRPKKKIKGSKYPGYVFFFTKRNAGELVERAAPFDELEVLLDDGRWSPSLVAVGREFTLWNDATFPRRHKTISVRVNVAGEWHIWQLPNPAAGQAFEAWPSPTFPLSCEVGDFKIFAKGWTKKGEELWLDYDLTYRGRPIANAYDTATVELWDATGNYTISRVQGVYYRNPWLSSRESAWKVRLSATAGLEQPLTANHVVSFGKARVPRAGEYTIMDAPATIGAKGDYFAAMFGSGNFGFRNGEFFVPRPRMGSPREYDSCTLSWYPDSWKIRVVRDKPGFVLVNLTNAIGKKWPGREVVFRYLDRENPGKMNVSSGSSDCHAFTLIKPPSDREIEIQALQTEEFTVEFLLPPPRIIE